MTLARCLLPLLLATTACAANERVLVTDETLITERLVGQKLDFNDGSHLVLNPDGSVGGLMLGAPPEGRWWLENGQFCRDFVIGDGRTLDGCHDILLDESSVRFRSRSGRLSPIATLPDR
ncbi:MAG: hypothetical protein AAFQ51_03430 [Pseudomonadota bacterium]